MSAHKDRDLGKELLSRHVPHSDYREPWFFSDLPLPEELLLLIEFNDGFATEVVPTTVGGERELIIISNLYTVHTRMISELRWAAT